MTSVVVRARHALCNHLVVTAVDIDRSEDDSFKMFDVTGYVKAP